MHHRSLLSVCAVYVRLCVCACQVFHDMFTIQGGVTLIASVLPSVTAVKTKANSQFEIFTIDNGQTTISL